MSTSTEKQTDYRTKYKKLVRKANDKFGEMTTEISKLTDEIIELKQQIEDLRRHNTQSSLTFDPIEVVNANTLGY